MMRKSSAATRVSSADELLLRGILCPQRPEALACRGMRAALVRKRRLHGADRRLRLRHFAMQRVLRFAQSTKFFAGVRELAVEIVDRRGLASDLPHMQGRGRRRGLKSLLDAAPLDGEFRP
jgi:hypothetical protein